MNSIIKKLKMLKYVELTASWLFANARGRDAKTFVKGPQFASYPEPTIQITSPDCGASPATLSPEYMAGGDGRLPELKWDSVPGVKQWLLICEDVDAPLPNPICHGMYLGISKDKLSVTNSDFKPEGEKSTRLHGGFYFGVDNVWIPPRPLLNHGIHRYFFDIIALSEPLDEKLAASKPTREILAKEVEGKVLGWGRWIGQCERVWK
ncbi:PEBP-like protein [Trichoderma evansii]